MAAIALVLDILSLPLPLVLGLGIVFAVPALLLGIKAKQRLLKAGVQRN